MLQSEKPAFKPPARDFQPRERRDTIPNGERRERADRGDTGGRGREEQRSGRGVVQARPKCLLFSPSVGFDDILQFLNVIFSLRPCSELYIDRGWFAGGRGGRGGRNRDGDAGASIPGSRPISTPIIPAYRCVFPRVRAAIFEC